MKPTEEQITNIANMFCRLQLGAETCAECIAYKNGVCSYIREKIISLNAVAFVIDKWEKIKEQEINNFGKDYQKHPMTTKDLRKFDLYPFVSIKETK